MSESKKRNPKKILPTEGAAQPAIQASTEKMTAGISRSDFLKTAATASLVLSSFPYFYCKPAGPKKLRIGFIPLTDCASVVMAHELGLYKKYGVDVEVSKEASWPNIRDKLLNGELTAAHCLFGMPFSVHTGIGGAAGSLMTVAMMLSQNGQAITLSNATFAGKVGFNQIGKVKGVVDAIKKTGKMPTFAMTFPGGTHDIWLRYWLGAAGINSVSDVKVIPIPPPQMVANMKVNNMDGYCVGEPWNGVAVDQKIGFTHLATQDIWKHHPEKALVFHTPFLNAKREETKAIMKAVLEASAWLDDMKNRAEAARVIGGQQYVNAPAKVIEGRLMGEYILGADAGKKTYKADTMQFYRGGQVNFPRHAYGAFYLAQYRRWNMLKSAPDYAGICNKLIAQVLYKEVAAEMKIAVPGDDMAPLTGFIDGVTFDPANPEAQIAKYKVRA